MADNRQIDQQQVRDHIDNVLQDCEQVFEKFFLAKFIFENALAWQHCLEVQMDQRLIAQSMIDLRSIDRQPIDQTIDKSIVPLIAG